MIVFFLGYSHVKRIAAEKQLNRIFKKKSILIILFHIPSPFPGHLLSSLHLSTNKQFGCNYVGQALESGAARPARWMGGMFPRTPALCPAARGGEQSGLIYFRFELGVNWKT